MTPTPPRRLPPTPPQQPAAAPPAHRPSPRRRPAATATAGAAAITAVAAVAAIAAVATLALAGCGGGTLGSNSSDGSVRLLNATTDFSALDFVTGSTSVASGVPGYTVSGYSTLDDTSYTFALRGSGSGVNLVSLSATLSRKSHTAFIAYTTGGVPTVTVLDEDAALPGSGTARLRVLNTASVEAGAVDVYVLPTATPCTAIPTATPPAASNLTLATGSAAIDLGVVASGSGSSYNVCVVAAGDKADLRLDFPAVAFADRGAATLVLAKTRSGVLLDGLLLSQQGALSVHRNTAARVRAVADLPAGGSVSVTATPSGGGGGGAAPAVTLVSGLQSPNTGLYRLVSAGSLALSINGSSAAVTRTLEAGTDVSLLVSGTGDAAVKAIVDDNTPSTSSSRQAKLRLVNGADGAAAATVDSAPVGDSVASGSASAAVNLTATTGTSLIAVTSNGVALPTLTGQTLAAGHVYSLFVLNGRAGTPELLLRVDR